ncbi:MAG: hypothetical protein F6K63_29850 [Moorea sp. SIO1G6]|uniref:hypothetical protein n=1 Tax=Moorena sp. SIO1G6 TaxID=2607840 RepID=UPI0013BFF9B7|nr:hypothetical protein [Moorena sp. SIO1G6]NET68374.1 hypothetical protein [Moorena sp. SIO1G6]
MKQPGRFEAKVELDNNDRVVSAWVKEIKNPGEWPREYGLVKTFRGSKAQRFSNEFDQVRKKRWETDDETLPQKFFERKWKGLKL